MKLSDLFLSNTIAMTNKPTKVEPQKDSYQAYRTGKMISNMKPGQTIQGEIVGRNGSEVQIKVNDSLILTAHLDKSMEMEPGKVVTFEIRNNSGGTLALSPLFENMGTDANVLKALDMAGLPVNQSTVAMTESMMQEGMAVDKNSLLAMYKTISNFPETSPSTLVSMQKLGIEITPESIQQYENYKNLEHQMIKDMGNILDEIPLQFESLLKSGDIKGAVDMYQAILDMLTQPERLKSDGMIQDGWIQLLTEGNGQENVTPMPTEGSNQQPTTQEGILQQPEVMTPGVTTENPEQTQQPEKVLQDNTNAMNSTETVVQNNEQTAVNDIKMTLSSLLDNTTLLNLTQKLEALGMDESILEVFKDGTLTGKEALEQIAKALQQLGENTSVHKEAIFSDKGFQALVRTELLSQWMLTPEQVQDKDNVDKLYERLNLQLSKLNEALATVGKTDTPLAKSVTNLQNNMDFMNQLNHMFSYVQLPLKMSAGDAHGDLYVYTNKRSLAKKDGNVSALLHLDMENLGPVDVYVAMQNKNVKTHFYLPDEEMLNFIEKHLFMLDERLAKRGYSMSAVTSVKNQEKSVVEEMLDAGSGLKKLTQYSFDVRA